MEIFHFLSMSSSAFNELVSLITLYVNTHPIDRDYPRVDARTLRKRIYKPRDILAMTIRYLSSMSENKDIHSQFGAVLTSFMNCVKLGMSAILSLIDHPHCRVFWDRSVQHCKKVSDRTKMFLNVPVTYLPGFSRNTSTTLSKPCTGTTKNNSEVKFTKSILK